MESFLLLPAHKSKRTSVPLNAPEENDSFHTSFIDEVDKNDQMDAEWRKHHARSIALAHKIQVFFIGICMCLWKSLFLIRVLPMKSTKMANWTQSGEGTMHEVSRLRTKVKGSHKATDDVRGL